MGRQANLKRERKIETAESSSWYLDLNLRKAAAFRNKLVQVQLALYSPRVVAKIQCLPSSFLESFRYLFGQVLVGARHWEFWDDIRDHLINVTSGEANQRALADWNHGVNVHENADPKIYCFNLLQKTPDMPSQMRIAACREEILRLGFDSEKIWFQEGIPHHLTISATIAGDGILHEAGSLYLLDAGKTRQSNHELWLARLRNDGIYATSRLGKIGNLRPSEVKSMKQFIAEYKGVPIGGRIEVTQGDDATRICKFLGMTIESGVAWIGK